MYIYVFELRMFLIFYIILVENSEGMKKVIVCKNYLNIFVVKYY